MEEDHAAPPALQRNAAGRGDPLAGAAAPEPVTDVLSNPGHALDPATRNFMEAGFGFDFGGVRVHDDAKAAASARDIAARAYTVGEHIAFDNGAYRPGDAQGDRLLAHELAHVVQQGHAGTLRSTGSADLAISSEPGSAVLRRDPDPRAQEADRAANEMWGAINGINEIGAEVEFTYYTSNGAMTLVSFKQTKAGSGTAPAVTLDKFKADSLGFSNGAAGSTLATFVGTTERYFKMTFRREAAKWSLSAWGDAAGRGPPPEGRAQPNASAAGWPVEIYSRVQTTVAKWIPVLQTYPHGSATLKLQAEFDDDRLTKLDLVGQVNTGGKGPAFAPAAPGTDTILTNTILGFSQGLGQRKINLTLEGAAPAGQTNWHVVEAATDRGPTAPMPDEATAIIADYRKMHADIIRKWREGVKDAGVMVAGFGAEQIAIWLIGGVVAKGLGLFFEAVAPRLLTFIRAGSAGGARAGIEYLETMVARLPIAERTEMQGLMGKMETEGLDALGAAEKKSLNGLLQKLESLIEAPMTTAEKDTLRGRMVARFGAAKPGVDGLFQAAGRSYQIHHRLPLEWAHKFPGLDVNAGKNLIGIETDVHRGVNAVWTRLRTSAAAAKVDGNVVSQVMGIVDRNFGKWYDIVPSTSGAALETEVASAKSAAYAEVDALVKAL